MSSGGNYRKLTNEEIESSNLTWRDHGPVLGKARPLPSHAMLKASKELGETKDTKQKALKSLRSLLQNGLGEASHKVSEEVRERFAESSDSDLVKFLRSRKYDVNKTVDLMKGYVQYRMNYRDLFTNIDEVEIRKHVVQGQPGVLPYRDNEGRVVMFFRVDGWDPVSYPFDKAVQAMVCVLEKLLENEETQINGLCLVEDFSGYTMSQVASVGISDYKRMIDMLQGSFPSRFKGVHCIRQPWYFVQAYNLIKPLLKAKLFDRIYIYGESLDAFYNHLPKECLPEELGGSGPPYDGEAVARMLFGSTNEDDEVTAF